jgi:DNA-binding ferritin-like protein (Dps family)
MSTWIDQKKRYRAYKTRVGALPEQYRAAVEALERYVSVLGPGRAEPLQQVFDDLAELFEQSAADGTPVRAVVGEHPVEFAEEFLRNYPAGAWIGKERDRLSRAIDRAEG